MNREPDPQDEDDEDDEDENEDQVRRADPASYNDLDYYLEPNG